MTAAQFDDVEGRDLDAAIHQRKVRLADVQRVPFDPQPTTPESHPEEWAEYERRRAKNAAEPIIVGKPGRCAGCGRFLAKSVFVNDGFPPTIMWGRPDFDPGFTQHYYRCTNPLCAPDDE